MSWDTVAGWMKRINDLTDGAVIVEMLAPPPGERYRFVASTDDGAKEEAFTPTAALEHLERLVRARQAEPPPSSQEQELPVTGEGQSG